MDLHTQYVCIYNVKVSITFHFLGNSKKQSNPFHCLKATYKCDVTLIISCETYLQKYEYDTLDTISKDITKNDLIMEHKILKIKKLHFV